MCVIHVCLHTVCYTVLFLADFCDFEMDFCGWVNNRPVESGIDWDWLSSRSEGSFLPDKDHTTDSNLGKSLHTNCNVSYL